MYGYNHHHFFCALRLLIYSLNSFSAAATKAFRMSIFSRISSLERELFIE